MSFVLKHISHTVLAIIAIVSFFVSLNFSCDYTYAIDNSFLITTSILGDNSPPTVPQNLIANAISYNQIDLSWDASTDDNSVASYNIYRDNTFLINVATTSFSDTGLSTNTTYHYNVSAVDVVANESALSATATATTLDNSLPPVDHGGGGGSSGYAPVNIYDFMVIPGYYSAYIIFKTDNPAQSILKWGENIDYEKGISMSKFLSKTHIIYVDDLMPGKLYYYDLSVLNGGGRLSNHLAGSFMTSNIPHIDYYPNVENLKAKIQSQGDLDDVLVSWDYPKVSNDGVLVLRTLGYFPIDKFDGKVVYEGKGNNFTDRVDKDADFYYTVFVKYPKNKFSSGATIKKKQINDFVKFPTFGEKDFIDISKIFVEQNGQNIRPNYKLYPLRSIFPVLVYIKKEDVPNTVAGIFIEIEPEPSDSTKSTYLFAYNVDKIRYESSFNLSPNFQYKFTIYFLNSKKNIVGINSGFFETEEVISKLRSSGGNGWYEIFIDFLWIIILLIILLILYLIYRKYFFKEKSDDESDKRDGEAVYGFSKVVREEKNENIAQSKTKRKDFL